MPHKECPRFFPSVLNSPKNELHQVNLRCRRWTCPYCGDVQKTKWELHLKNVLSIRKYVYFKKYMRPEWPALYHKAHRAKADYASIMTGQGCHLAFFSKPVCGAERITVEDAARMLAEAIGNIRITWRHNTEHPIRTSHAWALPVRPTMYHKMTDKMVARRAFEYALEKSYVDSRFTTWDGKPVVVGLTRNSSDWIRREIVEMASRRTVPDPDPYNSNTQCKDFSVKAGLIIQSNSYTDDNDLDYLFGKTLPIHGKSPPGSVEN